MPWIMVCWACASQTSSLLVVWNLCTGSATLTSFPSPSVQSSVSALQWPGKSRCTWHLLSSHQSLNVTLQRPKEEARKGCGQGKRSSRRSASHLALCLFGERNADTNQALGFSSRCESCMQICLLSPLLAVYIFHTKAIHIYKDCIRPGIYILRKDGLISAVHSWWEVLHDKSLPHYFRSQRNWFVIFFHFFFFFRRESC